MNAVTEKQKEFAADIVAKKAVSPELVEAFGPVRIIEAREFLRPVDPENELTVNASLAALVLASINKNFVNRTKVQALAAYYGGCAHRESALAALRLKPEQVEVVNSFSHLATACYDY